MSKATKKPAETKKDTTINENVEIEKKDQSLEEIKKEADKSFNKK